MGLASSSGMREVNFCVLFHYSEEEVTFEVQEFAKNNHEGLICSSKSIPGTGVIPGQRCWGALQN